MVEIGETLLAPTREAWRAWLAEHHATSAQIWLVLGKKDSGVQTVTLDEAMEEAVCFGWVDSIMKRLDDRTNALRFTPRKPQSVWSQSNVDRVQRLIAEGRMTPAGLALVEAAKTSGQWEAATRRDVLMAPPPELEAALAARPGGREGFTRLPAAHRRGDQASRRGSEPRARVALGRLTSRLHGRLSRPSAARHNGRPAFRRCDRTGTQAPCMSLP